MDRRRSDQEPRDEPSRRRFAAPSTPVLRPTADASASVDADTGCVHAVAVVGGPAAGQGRRVILRFSWDPADPLAVVIDIETRPDHPALPRGSWVVLRDFLRYGTSEPTGDGDVRIAPCDEGVELTLARAQRPCVVVVPAGTLEDFLARTERAVPIGEERSDALLDDLVRRLLSP